MRKLAVLVVLAAFAVSAAPAPKKRPLPSAPDDVPHTIAMFLCSLSNDGGRQVTYRARAMGVRFFFEQPGGVTVYRFNNGSYVKEEYLKNYSLDRAMKRYAKK